MLRPHPAQAAKREFQKSEQSPSALGAHGHWSACAFSLRLTFPPKLKSLSWWSLLLEWAHADFHREVSQTHPKVQFQGTHSHTILTHSWLLICSPEPPAQEWLTARTGKVVTPEWWGPSQCNYPSGTTSTCLFLRVIKFWERLWAGGRWRCSMRPAEPGLRWPRFQPFFMFMLQSQQDQKIPFTNRSWKFKSTQDYTKEFPKLN